MATFIERLRSRIHKRLHESWLLATVTARVGDPITWKYRALSWATYLTRPKAR